MMYANMRPYAHPMREHLTPLIVFMSFFLFSVVGGAAQAMHVSGVNTGDLVTCGTSATIYYIGSDDMRHKVPSDAVYASWYPDATGKADKSLVRNIPTSQCSQFIHGTYVPFHPGRVLVKVQNTTEVFAIDNPVVDGGRPVLRHVTSPAIAQTLYGPLWNKGYTAGGFLRTISQTVRTRDYTLVAGVPITVAEQFNPAAVATSATIEQALGIIPPPQPPPPPPIGDVGGIISPTTTFSIPTPPLPSVMIPFLEPTFGTRVWRVSDAPVSGGEQRERHEYSQLQAFNLDSSLMWQTRNGEFIVREVRTGNIIRVLPSYANAPRWNPVNGEEMIYFDGNDNNQVAIEKMNVRTGVYSTIMTLSSTYERVHGPISWEETSHDGRWMGAYLYRTDGDMEIVLIDLVNRTVPVKFKLNGDLYGSACTYDAAGPNFVAASPLGKLVVQWNADGTARCRGVEVYSNVDGSYLGHVADHRQHSDMGLDEQGNEVYVTTHFLNSLLLTTTRLPGSRNFLAGYDKIILDAGWDHVGHISCQGPNGVCVVSAYGDSAQPFRGEIYLVNTVGSAADNGQNANASVVRLAHHRSSNCEYYHQPQPSMSRDGNYVIFASDWGVCGNGVEDYIIDRKAGGTQLDPGQNPSPPPPPDPEPDPAPPPPSPFSTLPAPSVASIVFSFEGNSGLTIAANLNDYWSDTAGAYCVEEGAFAETVYLSPVGLGMYTSVPFTLVNHICYARQSRSYAITAPALGVYDMAICVRNVSSGAMACSEPVRISL